MDSYLEFLYKALPEFFKGTLLSLQIAGVSLLIGLAGGLPLAFTRVYGSRILRWFSAAYTEFFRGTPLLVQLFIIYYGLPQFGIVFSPLMSAYLALGLNSAAFQSEYFRGAIRTIGNGQMMAARSLGMSTVKAIWVILLPQTIRLVLPVWVNEVIYMIKNTAVVYLIAVPELMTQAKLFASRYFNPIESYSTVAVFYLVLVGLTMIVFSFIEKKLHIPGMEIENSRN